MNYKRVTRSNGTIPTLLTSASCRLWFTAAFGDFLGNCVLWLDNRWTFGCTGSFFI